jgi:pimeloyl-ACP methyl ester carboxylesterase
MMHQHVTIQRGLTLTSAGYMHYRCAGEGRAVIVLHINQQSSALCIETVTALAARYQAIAFDYPGHGASDHVIGDPSIGNYASWILEAMQNLGVSSASVVGEAIGAAIAIELANTSDRIENLVLVNCPYYRDRTVTQGVQSAMRSDLRPSDSSGFPATRDIQFMLERDWAHAPMRPTQSWMDRMNVAQLEAGRDRWQAIGALHRYDIPGRLTSVTQPILLLMGEHFQYTSYASELSSRIQQGRCDIIEGGRFCMTWERAEDIARKTIEFVG